MDDRRFDALTRSLARGTSRRTALKGLFAGVIGGAAITTRLDHAGAQTCESDTQCSQPDICTLAACIDGVCSTTSGCPAGELCCPAQGGSCAQCCDNGDCPAGTPICDTSGDPSNAICVECVASDDCAQPDMCTLASCENNVCGTTSGCPAGEHCCDAQGGSCAECCDGGDCPAGTPICYNPGDPTNAYCVECVDASDCAQPDACTLASCENNICGTASDCPAGETCCDVDGEGIDCVDLDAPDDQYCGACGNVCGPCETCVGGACVSTCSGCEVCDSGTCINGCFGECEVCDSGTCIPTECCVDSDCPDCYFCSDEHVCVENLCLIGEVCCVDECVPIDDCCRGIGDSCGLEITAADSSPQLDCCDGLVCCENWNSQYPVCAECCNDWDCPKGAWCNEGWCDWPDEECDYDKDCPKGTCCCKDGSCSGKCCHHPHPPKPPKPPKPAPPAPAPVTSLPATGAGESSDSTGLFGAAALGAAAALYAAKKMRDTPKASTEE